MRRLILLVLLMMALPVAAFAARQVDMGNNAGTLTGTDAGLTGYDFLRGTESYKSDWVSGQKNTVAVRVAHGRGEFFDRRELAARVLRDAAKKLLPVTLVDRVRRIRRHRSQI